ncbi:MAG: hypothetical protein Q9227_002319 [Pyrenula ochraceoflavens]
MATKPLTREEARAEWPLMDELDNKWSEGDVSKRNIFMFNLSQRIKNAQERGASAEGLNFHIVTSAELAADANAGESSDVDEIWKFCNALEELTGVCGDESEDNEAIRLRIRWVDAIRFRRVQNEYVDVLAQLALQCERLGAKAGPSSNP